MRILYCNKFNFQFSGTEAYIFEAMEMMRSRGHEVALFSMEDPRGQPTGYDHHFVPPVAFKDSRGAITKLRMSARAIYSRQARRNIRSMILDFQPDLAHVRNIYHHLTPSILWELRSQGIPVLYHLNDLKLLCPSYNMVGADGASCDACKRGDFYHVVSRGCYAGGFGPSVILALEAYAHHWAHSYEKCVDRFLAPSRFVRDKFAEAGWDASKFLVLPHFQKLSHRAVADPGPDAPVLYFGRLSHEKGLRDLIAAIARLPGIQFVFAGEGPQRRELQSIQQALGLRNLRIAGQLSGSDLEDLISRCQFTVFPSHAYETFGKSILESYAFGRAVVASDLGSRRELVTHNETGLLYPVGDVNRLVDAIRCLRDDPQLAATMGGRGRERAQREFSPERHFQSLTNIYEGLIDSNRQGRNRLSSRVKVAFIGGRGVVGKYSGIETYYEKVGEQLTRRGVDVTAYCRNYFTPEILTYRGIHVRRLPTIRSKHLDTFVHTLLSTMSACVRGYDIVHYHTLGPSLFSFFPRLFGKKTVVTVQGLDWQRKKWSAFARTVLKVAEQASITLPNRTVVVSHTLQHYYRQRYHRGGMYIPNAAEIRHRTESGSLMELNLDPDGYALFLGRLSPEKNCHILIQAFEQLGPAMKLVLAGGSSHTDEYAKGLRRRASERIVFLDWISGATKDAVLTNAALFVLPSDMEGLSLALLDAMGAGVCVLASDTPENIETIADAGFTFRRGDVEDLARMLRFLFDNPETRTEFGRKARARVEQNYQWGGVVKQHLWLYSHLVPGLPILTSDTATASADSWQPSTPELS